MSRAEDLALLRRDHWPWKDADGKLWCIKCNSKWPCVTGRIAWEIGSVTTNTD